MSNNQGSQQASFTQVAPMPANQPRTSQQTRNISAPNSESELNSSFLCPQRNILFAKNLFG